MSGYNATGRRVDRHEAYGLDIMCAADYCGQRAVPEDIIVFLSKMSYCCGC